MKSDKYEIIYDDVQSDSSLLSIINRLQHAIDSVRSRTRVSPSSRVVQWQKALTRLNKANKRSVLEQMLPSLTQGKWDHPYQDSFRALVDSRMFIEIVEQFLQNLSPSDLHDLVSGNLNPSDDRPSSRARDREFELFIAAICRRSGMKTWLGEPDVLLNLGSTTCSVAAKRLSSPKKVENNITKAERQIAQAGYPGFIVMDVTRILDPAGVFVTYWRNASQTVGGHLLAFTNTEHYQSLQQERDELVRGIILRTVFPFVSQGFRYGTYETWWAVQVKWGDAQLTNRFLERLMVGLKGT